MHFFLKKETADSAEDTEAVATADIAGITTSGTVHCQQLAKQVTCEGRQEVDTAAGTVATQKMPNSTHITC
jgi:hypothetical protein